MGLAQSHFSSKKLHGVNTTQAQEMLYSIKNVSWDDMDEWKKHGWCVIRHSEEENERKSIKKDIAIPNFKNDRDYVERHVFLENVS
jgi:tRNA(His) 5'-end guanylyltransferase